MAWVADASQIQSLAWKLPHVVGAAKKGGGGSSLTVSVSVMKYETKPSTFGFGGEDVRALRDGNFEEKSRKMSWVTNSHI